MNITKLTEEFVQRKADVKDCLVRGLINYSSLARWIIKEKDLNKKDFDAIVIALRRLHAKIKTEVMAQERILGILKKSKVEIKNKIIAAVIEKDIPTNNILSLEKEIKSKSEIFHFIEGSNFATIITSEDFTERIKMIFRNKIVKLNKSLAEIILKSPKEIEVTPGVVSYLYTLLSSNKINIIETMSCWTDTLFVIEEKDIAKVMEVLKF